MSEHENSGAVAPEYPAEQVSSAPEVTAGALLRYARETAGVHVEAVAVALKVPVNKLEALEADRYDVFPDTVFMRALAASMCRSLKVDPAPVLALLPSGAPQPMAMGGGLNASFKDPTGRFRAEASLARPNKSRWLGVLVAVLLAAALVIALYPRKSADDAVSENGASTNNVSTSEVTPSVEPVAPDAAASAPVSAPVPAAAASVAGNAPAAPVTAGAPGAAASVPVVAAGADASRVLEIRTREASWIKIVSSVNGVVLEREVGAGETLVAGGNPPYAVIVGRPEATDVFVRGQKMSMDGFGRGKVARFEVK